MKKVFLILFLILFLLNGCNTPNGDIILDSPMITEISSITITNNGTWCPEGYSWTTKTASGGATEIKINGIETEGKYKGYCYETYISITNGEELRSENYIDQEGNGFSITTYKDQIYKTEIKSNN